MKCCLETDTAFVATCPTQRIVTSLQQGVKARGLTLPPQLVQGVPGAAGASSGEGAGAGAGGQAGSNSLPLSMLLGGSLIDRMDLLGRTGEAAAGQGGAEGMQLPVGCAYMRTTLTQTRLPRFSLSTRLPAALHVAAATGRADVVRQLAASGAAVDKPLPMDYRALVRQRAGGAAAAGASSGGGGSGGASSDAGAPSAAHDDCFPAEAAAAAGGLGMEGPWGDAGDGCVPPPKRGHYVTAGPADPGPPSLQYCTALHLAALQGQLEVAQVLLATGQCDVNAKSIEGATPLHMAAHAGHAQVVAALCRAPGAAPSSPDLQGRTPLHLAAARGHLGAVTELWARGAAIDACDLHGWAPLQYAARAGHAAVAAQLVIAGAQVAHADPHGLTAAHLAAERGFAGEPGCSAAWGAGLPGGSGGLLVLSLLLALTLLAPLLPAPRHPGIVSRLLLAGYVADSVAGPLADGTEGGTALHLAAAQGCEEVRVGRCWLLVLPLHSCAAVQAAAAV